MLTRLHQKLVTGFKCLSLAACLLAVIASSGGHWMVLQTVAWTRMLITYSQHDSLPAAFYKTFDGQHPCRICLQIREGRRHEAQQPRSVPLLKSEKPLDLMLDDRLVLIPCPPSESGDAVANVPRWHPDFLDTPPTPPPKEHAVAL
jgi:hypothetical protein